MASDEFFLLAGVEIPDKKYYGDFLQIEDGVGAIRLLKDSFKKAQKKLKKKLKKKAKITIATATSPAKIFKEFAKEINVENLEFEVIEVKNNFFGSDINVAGLIVGEDIIQAIKDKNVENLVIPSVMLKKNGESYTNEFLDGKTLDDIQKLNKNIKIHILNDCYCFDEIKEIINNFQAIFLLFNTLYIYRDIQESIMAIIRFISDVFTRVNEYDKTYRHV